jgi:hypothetical protein
MKDIRSQGQSNLQQKEIGSIIKVGGKESVDSEPSTFIIEPIYRACRPLILQYILFEFNSSWWFRCNIIHYSINTTYFIDDS